MHEFTQGTQKTLYRGERMRCEILEINDDIMTVKAFDDINIQTLYDNAYNGRYFAYVEPLLVGTTTDEQRKHYWALINDISEYTGEPQWKIVLNMKYLYMMSYDQTKEPSMARNKMKSSEARKLIQTIIDYALDNDIPLRNDYLSQMETKQLYKMAMKRICWICNKPNSDIAHYEAVGMGRNRETIDHTQHKFMCLCREHHQEQHTIGIEEFCDKYHLQGGIYLNKESLKQLGVGR